MADTSGWSYRSGTVYIYILIYISGKTHVHIIAKRAKSKWRPAHSTLKSKPKPKTPPTTHKNPPNTQPLGLGLLTSLHLQVGGTVALSIYSSIFGGLGKLSQFHK